eukprot:364784-Chlamydomonas_euryale.AAC.17
MDVLLEQMHRVEGTFHPTTLRIPGYKNVPAAARTRAAGRTESSSSAHEISGSASVGTPRSSSCAQARARVSHQLSTAVSWKNYVGTQSSAPVSRSWPGPCGLRPRPCGFRLAFRGGLQWNFWFHPVIDNKITTPESHRISRG